MKNYYMSKNKQKRLYMEVMFSDLYTILKNLMIWSVSYLSTNTNELLHKFFLKKKILFLRHQIGKDRILKSFFS